MKITYTNNTGRSLRFKDVIPGNVFIHHDDLTFLRLVIDDGEYNAVCFENSKLYGFNDETSIKSIVKAELIIS